MYWFAATAFARAVVLILLGAGVVVGDVTVILLRTAGRR